MPGLNKQGPEGQGPMTGRQRGLCRRTETQGLTGDDIGRGRGMGRRCGQGQGRGAGQGQGRGTGQGRRSASGTGPGDPDVGFDNSEDLAQLKEQHQVAEDALITLKKKIAALEAGK